jgi:hypothetical protein
MDEDTTLQINVEGDQIIVTMRGTSFRTTYSIVPNARRMVQCLHMTLDRNARISRHEFETTAWEAAKH